MNVRYFTCDCATDIAPLKKLQNCCCAWESKSFFSFRFFSHSHFPKLLHITFVKEFFSSIFIFMYKYKIIKMSEIFRFVMFKTKLLFRFLHIQFNSYLKWNFKNSISLDHLPNLIDILWYFINTSNSNACYPNLHFIRGKCYKSLLYFL